MGTPRIYFSNSDWASKSDKDLKAYVTFNTGLSKIRNDANLTDLLTCKFGVTKALSVDSFEEFRTLAKGQGDRGTATIEELLNIDGTTHMTPGGNANPLKFKQLKNKAVRNTSPAVDAYQDLSSTADGFSLPPGTLVAYRTLDRLAACMALFMRNKPGDINRGCPIVILEHPSVGNNMSVTVFIKKSAINMAKIEADYFHSTRM